MFSISFHACLAHLLALKDCFLQNQMSLMVIVHLILDIVSVQMTSIHCHLYQKHLHR